MNAVYKRVYTRTRYVQVETYGSDGSRDTERHRERERQRQRQRQRGKEEERTRK